MTVLLLIIALVVYLLGVALLVALFSLSAIHADDDVAWTFALVSTVALWPLVLVWYAVMFVAIAIGGLFGLGRRSR